MIMMIVGARPQFIKSAPVIHELLKHRNVELKLIHTGQHYDPEMSDVFFGELDLPSPVLNLAVGSGSHATQTARMMRKIETCVVREAPSVVLVPGDTNSTLAGALAASKAGFPVGHVEAGLRSYDMSMPEEINRRLTDHCSTLLFAPTRTAVRNLAKEGLKHPAVFLTGDTMADSLRIALPRARKQRASVLGRFDLNPQQYVLVTLHRPGNVDKYARLKEITSFLLRICRYIRVVFTVHPRTRGRLDAWGLIGKLRKQDAIVLSPPVGYLEMLSLLENSGCVVTDSGGVQKEAFMLHVPCVTIRSGTEWPETLKSGANRLVFGNAQSMSLAVTKVLEDSGLRRRIRALPNPFGDGRASKRITEILLSNL